MRKLQVDCMIKALLLFGGIIMMQLVAYILCVIGYIIVGMLEGNAYIDVMWDLSKMMTSNTTLLMLMSAISALLSFIWCGILYKKSGWRKEGLTWKEVFTPKNTVAILGVGIGGCIVLTVILTVFSTIFPSAFENYTEVMSNFEKGEVWITLLYVLIIGPAAEEMIFRGAIFDRLHLAYPFWLANVLQAILFGVYHMNLIQGLYAFCVGILLGIIVNQTGSVFASIMAHIVFNSTTYLFGYVVGDGQGYRMVLFVVIFVLGVIALWKGIRYFTTENHSNPSL